MQINSVTLFLQITTNYKDNVCCVFTDIYVYKPTTTKIKCEHVLDNNFHIFISYVKMVKLFACVRTPNRRSMLGICMV
jgi:hypothetical protein